MQYGLVNERDSSAKGFRRLRPLAMLGSFQVKVGHFALDDPRMGAVIALGQLIAGNVPQEPLIPLRLLCRGHHLKLGMASPTRRTALIKLRRSGSMPARMAASCMTRRTASWAISSP